MMPTSDEVSLDAASRGGVESSFSVAEILALTEASLVALGVPEHLARPTAESLTEANLMGHDSHGLIRLLQYSGWIADGQIRPDSEPVVLRRSGATAVVDGGWGLGQPAARLATQVARDLALEHGVSAVTITRCNHIGRLGEYVAELADAGCVGTAYCNSGPVVAPAGGTRRTLGTNPFAWAAPQAGGPPIVLDFSTAAVAEGKLRVAQSRGQRVADGILIDAAGRPTREPDDFYAGGALLAFGGHKGAGLALMIELVAGLLSGMGAAPMADYAGGNGTALMAISIAAFTDAGRFAEAAALFGARVAEAADGTHDPEILLPGELETRTREIRRRTGIPVPDRTRREITELVAPLGVDLGRFGLR
jgi:LDH2 family malate/lactate/ureidoglycolate dehydrogenase